MISNAVTRLPAQWGTLLLLSLLIACQSGSKSDPYASPDQRFGPLFERVQQAGLFSDSKTFADAIPLEDPPEIVEAYRQRKDEPNFNLSAFVDRYFRLPSPSSSGFEADTNRSVRKHILALWPYLQRGPDTVKQEEAGSLIPLPHPYVVPGGRFREVYYWDSYFTMLGLAESGKVELIEDMLHNFAYLVDQFGFIPNGNRTYYLSRSQPPFFALMVQLYGRIKGDSAILEFLPQLEQEYTFWMKGSESLAAENPAFLRVVRMPNGAVLNRYWDDNPRPRPEAYLEDVETASRSGRPNEAVWRDLRAACESGWDFSSRWLADPPHLHSIHTTDIVPVDLNSLLFHLEETLVRAYYLKGEEAKARAFKNKSLIRMRAMIQYLWDKDGGYFGDYDFKKQQLTGVKSLATMYPLFFGISPPVQAMKVSRLIENEFLYSGGVVTTLTDTGQQWDFPNGWAPLHWITIKGLENYKFFDLASEIRQRWVSLNKAVYQSSGKLTERYNVVTADQASAAGEYPVQDGFGWTNGVLLSLLNDEQ